jgi:hypothetical protein
VVWFALFVCLFVFFFIRQLGLLSGLLFFFLISSFTFLSQLGVYFLNCNDVVCFICLIWCLFCFVYLVFVLC